MVLPAAACVEAVRRFSRFYTREIGLLHEGLLGSAFSLAEARVLYELAQRDPAIAAELALEMALDPSYLSRILRGFERRGLITKSPSPQDRRQRRVTLTAAGEAAFAELDARSAAEIRALLAKLAPRDQRRLVGSMGAIEAVLGGQPDRQNPKKAYVLRPHEPGDLGWVVSRHAALYAKEYGWDGRFEGMVAGVVAAFAQNYDPRRERCWIAELDGEPIGSVCLVGHTDEIAKLRLLLVEPRARGLGVGRRLVEECIRFARRVDFAKVILWTDASLLAARAIYEQAGFRLIHQEPHHSFGHDLIGETWELVLRSQNPGLAASRARP